MGKDLYVTCVNENKELEYNLPLNFGEIFSGFSKICDLFRYDDHVHVF